MKQITTWYLVCDASRAQLFEEALPKRPCTLIGTFDHPSSRLRISELMADAQGRKPVGGSRGDGVNGRPGGFHGRSGTEPDTDPKEVEAQKFARELAAELKKGLDAHAYEALVIAAPPHFLGLLKDTIDDQVTKRLRTTIDKDLAPLATHEIKQRLRAARAA